MGELEARCVQMESERSDLQRQLEEKQNTLMEQAQLETLRQSAGEDMLCAKRETESLRNELDQMQALQADELKRKQAEIDALTEQLTSLRNEWLQKSAAEAQQAGELRAQILALESSLELAGQATAQVDVQLDEERRKCAALQAQVQSKLGASADHADANGGQDLSAQAMVSQASL